jgi:anti-sigma B factor antagonist
MENLSTDSHLIPSAQMEGDALVLSIRGEIDLHNSPELRIEIFTLVNRQRPHRLVLDLSQVPYMDSSTLAVFVEVLKRILKEGGKLFLTGLQPRVKGLIEIARLSSIFGICADVQEALKQSAE